MSEFGATTLLKIDIFLYARNKAQTILSKISIASEKLRISDWALSL